MSYAQRITVAVTVDASGDATVYSPVVTGKVSAVHYVKDDFADGVDFTITSESTGQSIWTESNVNASASRAPRQATHSTAGAAALYASGGAAVLDQICLAHDRIKIVVAEGGNATSGSFVFILN